MWVEERNGKFRAYERYTDRTGVLRRVSVPMDKNTAQERKKASNALILRVAALSDVSDSITFQMIIDSYLEYQKINVKKSTYRRNSATFNRLAPVIGGNVPADKLTAGLISSRLLEYTKNPTTYNEYIKRLKAMLRWAYRNDYINTPDPYAKLQNLKDQTEREKVQFKYLEKDELQRFLAGLDVPLWEMVTRFLALSGLRVGELIALDMDDIDFKERKISVTKTYDYRDKETTTPKTLDSKRLVHMQAALFNVAKDIKAYTQRFAMITGYRVPYFVISLNGSRMNYFSYNKYLRENSERILNRSITAHALRHTHVALMAAHGVPLEVLSRRLGHGDSKITRTIYFHITKDLQTSDALLIDSVAGNII